MGGEYSPGVRTGSSCRRSRLRVLAPPGASDKGAQAEGRRGASDMRRGGALPARPGGCALQKALVGLYMVRAALETGVVRTVLIDEPDNYVGLPELQPWTLALMELLDEDHQAVLISHHPEILNYGAGEGGVYLWRDNHTSPT